jgi:hypothetical protein
MSRLEARASRLLRAYPPSYRAEHGDEVIGTLLDASPRGRNWPAPREAWSLVAGGLRARAAANRQQPAVGSIRLTLLLAAVLWLTWEPYQVLSSFDVSPLGRALSILGMLLVSVTIAAPWFAPRPVVVLLAVGTAVALGLVYHHIDQTIRLIYLAPNIVPPIVLAVTAAAGSARPSRAWLWLPGGLVAASILMYAQGTGVTGLVSSLIGVGAAIFAFGSAGVAVLWFVVDVRPPMAFLIGYEWMLVPVAAFNAIRGSWLPGPYYVYMAVPLAAGVVALTVNRLLWKLSDRFLPYRG